MRSKVRGFVDLYGDVVSSKEWSRITCRRMWSSMPSLSRPNNALCQLWNAASSSGDSSDVTYVRWLESRKSARKVFPASVEENDASCDASTPGNQGLTE